MKAYDMKVHSMVCLMLFVVAGFALAQYPQLTIREIQEVQLDSLLLLDTLQCTQPAHWTLQASPYYLDTVTVTAVCVVPARVMSYTVSGFNLLLADTGSHTQWAGLFVRPGADTLSAIQWGILNVEQGDIIRFVGYVDEFPTGSCESTTEIVPILSIPLEIIGTASIAPHLPVKIAEFSSGGFPGGQVRYSTGERYEYMRVLIRNAVIITRDITHCVFSMIDSLGNVMYSYNARPTLQCPTYPIGTTIDTIRGFVLRTSGSEMQLGYRIAIVDSTDVVVTNVKDPKRTGTILSYSLEHNSPNPVNSVTTISFNVPVRSTVSLKVFDILGREVSTLLSEDLLPGTYSRQWDATGLASGVYLYQLRTGIFVQTNKLILLR